MSSWYPPHSASNCSLTIWFQPYHLLPLICLLLWFHSRFILSPFALPLSFPLLFLLPLFTSGLCVAEDNFQECFLSFYHLGSKDGTHSIRFTASTFNSWAISVALSIYFYCYLCLCVIGVCSSDLELQVDVSHLTMDARNSGASARVVWHLRRSEEGIKSPRNWNFRKLWATTYVLGIEPVSSQKSSKCC